MDEQEPHERRLGRRSLTDCACDEGGLERTAGEVGDGGEERLEASRGGVAHALGAVREELIEGVARRMADLAEHRDGDLARAEFVGQLGGGEGEGAPAMLLEELAADLRAPTRNLGRAPR